MANGSWALTCPASGPMNNISVFHARQPRGRTLPFCLFLDIDFRQSARKAYTVPSGYTDQSGCDGNLSANLPHQERI